MKSALRHKPGARPATLIRAASTLLFVAFAPSAPAQTPDAGKLLETAIAFHGGREALAALPHLELTGTVENRSAQGNRTVDAVYYERADGGLRSEVTMEFRGRKVTSVTMYDGKMCKRRFRSTWDDIPLDEYRERAAHRLPFLLEALARGPVVAGEGTEVGTDVWRIEVPDGRAKAVLSLAKDDGRLVALEYPGTEAEGMGTKKEIVRKLVFRELHDVNGIKIPADIERFEDGIFDGRERFTNVAILDEWDESWLQVPDPRRRFIPGEELAF